MPNTFIYINCIIVIQISLVYEQRTHLSVTYGLLIGHKITYDLLIEHRISASNLPKDTIF